MKQIYLCGPVTGDPGYREHFSRVEESIAARANRSLLIVNPALLPLENTRWETCMRYCLKAMLDCGGIALLRGWQHSRGARMELTLAGQLKIPVVYLEPPVDESALALLFGTPVCSDVPRYLERRIAALEANGCDEALIRDRALYETETRYLDPHGFEYIDREYPVQKHA
ncbi:MAG: DUF4406 domain-containing protein [Treponema sp.]|jgi:hypothetical protein|nr:DUF4406 domain-containing protein [Treponema sp.]